MADLATRVVVTGPWVVHHSSVYSSRLCPVTRLHEALFHFCSTVRLHTPLFLIRLRSAPCSAPRSAPRSGPLVLTSLDSAMSAFCSTARLLDSTRLALRAFLFYLLVEFGRHAVHTHSVPRVVSRHSVITHLLSHSCSHRRCCLVWSSVIPWVPLVPLVPLVLLRGASLLPVYRLLSSQSLFSIALQCNAVQCSALYSTAVHCTGAFNRWFLCRSLVLLESFWSPSGVLLESFWSPSSVVVVRSVVIAASRVFRHEGC